MPPRWIDEEIVVVLYFRARGITAENCASILNHKRASCEVLSGQPSRTLNGVNQKLKEIHKGLDLSLEATNQRILEMDPSSLAELTSANTTELKLMGKVCPIWGANVHENYTDT